MMKIVVHSESSIPNFSIVGSINEKADFSLISLSLSELHLDGYEVDRINSTGVRHWMKFMELLKSKGIKVKFYQVSTALIEQFNAIRNFGGGGEVVSATVPFVCLKCGKTTLKPMTKVEVLATDFDQPKISCQSCQSDKIEFDDDRSEYFHFWGI